MVFLISWLKLWKAKEYGTSYGHVTGEKVQWCEITRATQAMEGKVKFRDSLSYSIS